MVVDDCVVLVEGTSLARLITVVWLLRVLLDDEPYDAVMYTLLALVSEIDSRG